MTNKGETKSKSVPLTPTQIGVAVSVSLIVLGVSLYLIYLFIIKDNNSGNQQGGGENLSPPVENYCSTLTANLCGTKVFPNCFCSIDQGLVAQINLTQPAIDYITVNNMLHESSPPIDTSTPFFGIRIKPVFGEQQITNLIEVFYQSVPGFVDLSQKPVALSSTVRENGTVAYKLVSCLYTDTINDPNFVNCATMEFPNNDNTTTYNDFLQIMRPQDLFTAGYDSVTTQCQ
jgi:hypothetical protein